MAVRAVRGKARLLEVAQRAADELGFACHAHSASPVPEDPASWVILFTGGYGRVRVRVWDGGTEHGVKEEVMSQLRGREGRREGGGK